MAVRPMGHPAAGWQPARVSTGMLLDRLALGPARRRHWMTRRLAELDALDALDARFGGYAAVPAARRRAPAARAGVAWVAALAVAGTAGLLWARSAVGATAEVTGFASVAASRPLPADAATGRLLPPVAGPSGSGGFAFMASSAAGPARYDPCRPIHLVVNDAAAPPGADAIVAPAVERVSAATGLSIVVDGPTDEPATEHRPTSDPARYGRGWSPVLLAWTTPRQIPRLGGATAGLGGSSAVQDSRGRLVYVTGTVYLDGPDLSAALARPHGRAQVTAIVLHELGHLVGLDHVSSPDELMFRSNVGRTSYGPGDLRGLALLGQGACEREF